MRDDVTAASDRSGELPSGGSLEQGLERLLRAFRYAREASCDPWVLAVELAALERAGMSTSDLRWLLAAGHAMHAHELTHPADVQRRFGPRGLATISERSCFVLTPSGAKAVWAFLSGSRDDGSTDAAEKNRPSDRVPATVTEVLPDRADATTKPVWDRERRELRFGKTVIKRFRVPARNQELLLAAFQEQDWPEYIDDPLVPLRDQDPKERLKAAIRCLNRNQLAKLIRFRGNGNGMRIYWERIE
jgi:hypothetical protein